MGLVFPQRFWFNPMNYRLLRNQKWVLTKCAVDREIAALCLYCTRWVRVSRPQRFRVFLAASDTAVRRLLKYIREQYVLV
jgi:hypothetical protein